jgi:hypothetical protein
MKKIGVVSIAPQATLDCSVPFDQFYESFGKNTGNYMFTQAMFRQLRGDIRHIGFGYDPGKINDELDHVVVPAANWLNSYSNWDWLTEIFERTKVPVTTLGLGVQCASGNLSDIVVTDSAIRLVRVMASKSPYLSVRGDFTRDWLDSIGIHNVLVTGCPSLYMRLPELQGPLAKDENFIVQSTRYGTERSFVEADGINRALFSFAFEHNANMIYQSEIEEICFLSRNYYSGIDTIRQGLMCNMYGASSFETVLDYIHTMGKVFFDLDVWSNFLQASQGVIGTRLHGSIIALNSGTPAILIAHDSRTSELADFARIPTCTAKDSIFSDSKAGIIERLKAAPMDQYLEARTRNGVIYRAFLSACNLPYREEALF